MNVTHNNINEAIAEMEAITEKGQRFVKSNRDRKIRSVLRDMRIEQRKAITLKDIWFYFKLWLSIKVEKNMIEYCG